MFDNAGGDSSSDDSDFSDDDFEDPPDPMNPEVSIDKIDSELTNADGAELYTQSKQPAP